MYHWRIFKIICWIDEDLMTARTEFIYFKIRVNIYLSSLDIKVNNTIALTKVIMGILYIFIFILDRRL